MLHSLKEISKELFLAPFALKEFIINQTTKILTTDSLSSLDIDGELYSLIKRKRSVIEAIESYRDAELNFKIAYFEEHRSMLDIDDYDFGWRYKYFDDELTIARGELLTREHEAEEVFSTYEDDTEDTVEEQSDDDDQLKEDRYENEYSVYNNFGFVTWSFSLQEAQQLATKFNGYIKDKYGREVT